jgi:hypothetical protein
VRLDAIQVLLHQALASELAALRCAANTADRSFYELKLLPGGISGHENHSHRECENLRL